MEETLATTAKSEDESEKKSVRPKLACLVRLVKYSQNKQGEEKDQDSFFPNQAGEGSYVNSFNKYQKKNGECSK